MIKSSDITPKWLFYLLLAALVFVTLLFTLEFFGVRDPLTGLKIDSDPMYISGFVTILTALWLSMPVESRFVALAQEIDDQYIVHDETGRFIELARETAERARIFSFRASIIVGLVVGFGYYFFYFHSIALDFSNCAEQNSSSACWNAFKNSDLMDYVQQVLAFFSVSLFLAFFVGQRLGTMAGLATAVRFLSRPNVHLRLIPSHNDGRGGVEGLASYIAFLGIVAAIPVIWLGIWLVIINQTIAPIEQNYSNWSLPFILQLITAVGLLTYCFILPFRSITKQYTTVLQVHLHQAEVALQTRLMSLERDTDERSLEEYKHLRDVQKLPKYPIAPQLKNLFTVASATPFFMLALGVALGSNSIVVRVVVFFLG